MKKTALLLVAFSLVGARQAPAQAGAPPGAQTAPPAAVAGAKNAAYLGELAISDEELEKTLRARLLRIRQEEYETKVEGIKDHAFRLLREREAARLGISGDELYRRNVTEKVTPPTAEEIQDLLARFRSQLPVDEAEARKEVTEHLRHRSESARAEAWRDELLAGARLKIVLEPPRIEVTVDPDDPAIGPPEAPVTVIEFSDFQCPYCAEGQATLSQLRADYGDALRLVFKQYPLPMHSEARMAAEASLCANDQGKLSEARAWLFGHASQLSVAAIKGWAAEAGLDPAAFAACLDEHRHAKSVDADLAYAESIEINSTPIYFVNGRLVSGARPIGYFKEIVDQELARAGRSPAAPAASR